MRATVTYAWCDQCGDEPAPAPPARQQYDAPNGWFNRIFTPRQRGRIVNRNNPTITFSQGSYHFAYDVDRWRRDREWVCDIHQTTPRFIRQWAAWQRRITPIELAYETFREEITIRNGLPPEMRDRGQANLTQTVTAYRLRRPPANTMTRMWPR